jgi:endonuclease/exonuclease/phosphatase family metal-dependent hydrolase
MPQLRVATYNVHGLRDDLDALGAVVRDLAPDVLVVQESPRRLRWRTRCADLAHRCGLVYGAGGGPALGNLILVSLRVAVPRAWALRYPLVPGRHLRGAVFARCVVSGVPLTVAGTHLGLVAVERLDQARRLRTALADLGGGGEPDAPTVLAGDFNEPADGPARRLLGEGRVDAAGADGTPTFPAAGGGNAGERIDALLVDSAVTVSGYRVVSSAVAARASDHLPVVVDLSL